VASVVNGTFEGGIVSLGLAEGGVGISGLSDLNEFIDFGIAAGAISADAYYEILANWARNRATVPSWIWGAVAELEAGILDGTILVPSANTPEEIREIRERYPLIGE